MALLRYRCTHTGCRMRITLRQPPECYRRIKRCPDCRGRLRLDRWRHEHETGPRPNAGVCRCDGWPFPHRRGSLWCHHGPEPTAEQMAERYGVAVTEDA